VSVARTIRRPTAPGSYEIRSLVPASESDPQDPRYRIRSASENHDRIVPESDLAIVPAGDSESRSRL